MKGIKRAKHGPEFKIQGALIEYLKARRWYVERMIGNAFQVGVPDLYVAHPKYGTRWIDVKNPGKYSFTKAQKLKWPIWEAHGIGIWIPTAPTQAEYDKLFALPNWRRYWKDSWGEVPDVDALLDELDRESRD